ncbi:porin family protein [Vibrio agarivorans]|uniref:porin family protein n=1 Tax=Vibrio agarivorans TaxID=153622 RepID=UPI00222F5A23|nr:porin family protein [Vibrio agarivorans]
MKKTIIACALVATAFSGVCNANAIERGAYVGLGFGSTILEDDGAFRPFGSDDTNNTYKLVAGYQFNKIVAVEAQYTNYGDIDFVGNYSLAPTSFSVAANLGYSFNNGLRPYGIIGLGLLDLDPSGTEYLEDDSTVSIHYGLGLEYMPSYSDKFSVRVGYEGDLFIVENYWTDYTVSVGSFYVGAHWRF